MSIYRLYRAETTYRKCVECGNCTTRLPVELHGQDVMFDENTKAKFDAEISAALDKCFLEILVLEGPT